jgi:hypothetical protein
MRNLFDLDVIWTAGLNRPRPLRATFVNRIRKSKLRVKVHCQFFHGQLAGSKLREPDALMVEWTLKTRFLGSR